MNRFERHPILTLAAVLGVALVAILAVSEWVLERAAGGVDIAGDSRAASPERFLQLREWQPGTQFSFSPPETRVANANGDVLPVYPLDTDRDGFIEPSVIHQDPDVEIVFVGGSTTECMYVRPENRFPYLVGRLLEARLGRKVNGINAGKSGNNTMLSLLAAIGKVLPRRPDYVVLMQATNDLAVLSQQGTYWTNVRDTALVVERERSLESLVRDIRDMTVPYTYRRLRRALQQVVELAPAPGAGQARAAQPAPAAEQDGDDVAASRAARRERMAADFESALRSFVAVARAWCIQPVLMTQVLVLKHDKSDEPALQGAYLTEEQLARGDFTAASFGSAHEYFNAIIRHVALSEGIPLIDLARARAWSEADVYDGLHFIDAGSQRVAEVVSDAMAPLIEEKLAATAP